MAEPRHRYYPRTLIFLHLPKAAGTTLQDIIMRQYPGSQAFRFTGNPQRLEGFKALPEAERARFDVLLGHVHFGLHRWVPGPSTYLTMLRDPVDRVVSHYYFVLQHPEHYLHSLVTGHGYTLHDYIANRTCIELDNDQTRYFMLREHREVPHGSMTRAMLDEAKGVLEAYVPAIGLAERFDESLVYFQCLFGWLDVSYQRKNVTKERAALADVPRETLDLIRETNAFDIELYEHAKRLFESRVAAVGEAFGRRVEVFKQRQAEAGAAPKAAATVRAQAPARRPQAALH